MLTSGYGHCDPAGHADVGALEPGALERLLLGVDGIVDAAGAGLDIGAAEFLLGEILAEPFDDRRARDEHRGVLRHQPPL